VGAQRIDRPRRRAPPMPAGEGAVKGEPVPRLGSRPSECADTLYSIVLVACHSA
jgi:hypothetical protein